jgi:hypothetical protein
VADKSPTEGFRSGSWSVLQARGSPPEKGRLFQPRVDRGHLRVKIFAKVIHNRGAGSNQAGFDDLRSRLIGINGVSSFASLAAFVRSRTYTDYYLRLCEEGGFN